MAASCRRRPDNRSPSICCRRSRAACGRHAGRARVQVWVFSGQDWLVRDAERPYVAHENATCGFQPTSGRGLRTARSIPPPRSSASARISAVLTRCEAHVRAALGGARTVARSQPYYLDITHPLANKGAALSDFAELLDDSAGARLPSSATAATMSRCSRERPEHRHGQCQSGGADARPTRDDAGSYDRGWLRRRGRDASSCRSANASMSRPGDCHNRIFADRRGARATMRRSGSAALRRRGSGQFRGLPVRRLDAEAPLRASGRAGHGIALPVDRRTGSSATSASFRTIIPTAISAWRAKRCSRPHRSLPATSIRFRRREPRRSTPRAPTRWSSSATTAPICLILRGRCST